VIRAAWSASSDSRTPPIVVGFAVVTKLEQIGVNGVSKHLNSLGGGDQRAKAGNLAQAPATRIILTNALDLVCDRLNIYLRLLPILPKPIQQPAQTRAQVLLTSSIAVGRFLRKVMRRALTGLGCRKLRTRRHVGIRALLREENAIQGISKDNWEDHGQ
jgi:hypothetical protein